MSVSTQSKRPLAALNPALVPRLPIWRISVNQYHAMIRSGVFGEDDPVELLDGWLVVKMTKNPPHSKAVGRARRKLEAVLPAGWYVRIQDAVTLPTSEPEPDLAVARGDEDRYGEHHPGPADLAMIVEVADASLRRDRGLKRRLYAHAAIPVYWLVNLVDRQLEVYTQASGPTRRPDYHERRDYGVDEEAPVLLEGREVARIAVRDLLT